MYIAPKELTKILAQQEIGDKKCQALVRRFQFGSGCWKVLGRIELPELLLDTREPLLLALRRLVRKDIDDLRTMHRVAAIEADKRPFGLLFLMLEEVVELEHPNGLPTLEEDLEFQSFLTLLPHQCCGGSREDFAPLMARTYAEAARRQIATGDPEYRDSLLLAYRWALDGRGGNQGELKVFLLETTAQGNESHRGSDTSWIPGGKFWAHFLGRCGAGTHEWCRISSQL